MKRKGGKRRKRFTGNNGHPIVEVAWLDAAVDGGAPQHCAEIEDGVALRVSVGFLVRKTRRSIALAQSSAPDHTWQDVLHVPQQCVHRVRVLRRRSSVAEPGPRNSVIVGSIPTVGSKHARRKR